MLNPEAAKEQLNAFRSPDPDTSIAPLSGNLKAICWGLLARDAHGKPLEYSHSHQAVAQAKRDLVTLGEADRRAVFGALFPGVARQVEAAWQMFRRMPYQTGGARKPFRAADGRGETDAARLNWLQQLIHVARPFGHQAITWFAAWATYLGGYHGDAFGVLLAAAIDQGDSEGEEVFQTLLASGRGEHETGAMGRHVTRALLGADRPEGWAFVEKLLLAAQRQEGLRQAILEAVDEAHPRAFRRMLTLIREHDLIRFSATIRAVDVWLGFGWDAMNARSAARALTQIETFLEDPMARAKALAAGDAPSAYLALWATAFMDATAAIPPARALLSDPDADRRFAAVHLLTQLGLSEAQQAIVPALDDADLRVALLALRVQAHPVEAAAHAADVFERLERLYARLPAKSRVLDPMVWEWMSLTADRAHVADTLTRHPGARPPQRLLPYLNAMSSYGRGMVVDLLAGDNADGPEVRDALLGLVGDTAEHVRGKALKAVAKSTLSAAEAERMEGLLTRKSGDLRRAVLALLLAQEGAEARRSSRRLLAAKDPLPRIAGLEMLQQMVRSGRGVSECRALAAEYRKNAKTNPAEDAVLDVLLDEDRQEPTLENGLGLFDPARCSPRLPPAGPKKLLGIFSVKPEPLITPAAVRCLQALDALVHAHRETPIKMSGQDEMLLGNLRWGFPAPPKGVPLDESLPGLPLSDVWTAWNRARPAAQRDPDGLELLRASVALCSSSRDLSYSYRTFDRTAPWWIKANETLFADAVTDQLAYRSTVSAVLAWLRRLSPSAGAPDVLLDGVETTLAMLPEKACGTQHGLPLGWLAFARRHRDEDPADWRPEHHVRLWQMTHWLDNPGPGVERQRPPLAELLAAHQHGAANDTDLLDQLIGPRPTQGSIRHHFAELSQLTGRRPSPLCEAHPGLQALADRCRDRVLEIELKRGELPTAASAPALALRSVEGAQTLIRLLRVLGTENLLRGRQYGWWSADTLTKGAVFSHLLRITFPARTDTPQDFAARVKEAGIGPKRLIELAIYAPQWAGFVQHALGWPEFAEAVWWLHAHTKDTQWTVDQEIRELWAAQSSERTPLSSQSLLDGAVDVAWFARIHSALGAARWSQIDEAAKYASGGAGHKRAQLFADAMLGRVGKAALCARITQKRSPDAVRALGLVPLETARESDVLDRYQVVQEFRRGSRQFGAQRQASEKMAASIGLENLARTAGYPDPVRLEWAMEAQSVADLAAGPVRVTAGEVSVTLSIDEWGAPALAVAKNGKALKAIPPAIRKTPAVAELAARKTEIERQSARMRLSLEEAMCRGDLFTGAELSRLLEHPVLAPMLRSLVLVGGGGLAGYPVEGGARLEGLEGSTQTVRPETSLRIAHPHDLLQTDQWHAWQRDCFLRERIQPFKQVFRELYLPAQTERGDGHGFGSRRYAGHQVNRGQAFALLGKRGWVGNPYEGDARRTFHDAGITASVGFDYGYTTPAEVEGLTIDQVVFTRRGDWKALDLGQVPPRVFSEAMRDLDLVVSVAHQGGVDPEASASTVEMRSALLREACGLMKLGNVRLQNSHALIDGHLGTYSVHLGSAVVHRQPGGHLCIVPVHGQHRGRLFLPFVDDDPRTAEVLSKVLLLARDTEIKDPTILEQIMA